MKDDPVVTEVIKNRRAILESYDWDFEKMSRDAMKRQWKNNHKFLKPKKKQFQKSFAPNAYPLHKEA
jgi:hypothetical protein